MKSLLAILLSFTINAYACTLKTYIVDGRVITCSICGNVINCS